MCVHLNYSCDVVINLPRFERLDVDNYGLYPGRPGYPGLHALFDSGTTLVMGANGLGKSTLVLMLQRMCTGPTDISAGSGPGDLGYSQLSSVGLPAPEAQTFAARVNDRAVEANATLEFSLGDQHFEITRQLRDLRLTAMEVDGASLSPDELAFQNAVTRAAGLDRFVDWLLIQRYLTFYGDDRKSLVWDRTAQRQLLRLLFLPASESGKWLELEREFLRQATQYRNYRAIVAREATNLSREEAKLAKVPSVTAEINSLANQATSYEADLERVAARVEEDQALLRSAELEALRATEERETAYRELERSRLGEIQAAFPTASATAAYLIGQIISGNTCLVCGTNVPEFAEILAQRVTDRQCVICGSPTQPATSDSRPGDFETLELALEAAETRLREVTRRRADCNARFAESLRQMRQIEAEIRNVQNRLKSLNANLPSADRKIRDRQVNVASMQATATEMRAELDAVQDEYQEYVELRQRTIGERKDEVKAAFGKFAREFLVEDCELVWDSYQAPIGQINEPTEFYVFEIDMTGGAVSTATRRERAQDVSESQREFIDLAFRMALISVAGSEGRGTLVIDTPESSLDAVFAPRAARVLAEFGEESPHNRLIVTSNLIDGDLIPTLLRLAGIHDRSDSRVIDLIGLAEPTAAVREWRAAYDAAVERVFDRATSE